MFAAIGFDLDGTLLTSNKTISDASYRQLSRLITLGISVIIVSGRHYREIKSLLDKYEIEGVSYIISCDGQYIHDASGCIVYSAGLMGKGNLDYVFRLLKVNRLYCFSSEKNFCVYRCFWDQMHFKFLVHVHNDNLESVFRWGKRGNIIEKIVVEGYELSSHQEYRLKEYYTLHKLEKGKRLELLPFGVSKYQALSYLAEIGSLDMDSFLYFGDDYNDEECFLNLPHCVVMHNAPPELHHYSEFSIGTNDNDGIACLLDRLFVE